MVEVMSATAAKGYTSRTRCVKCGKVPEKEHMCVFFNGGDGAIGSLFHAYCFEEAYEEYEVES